MPRGANALGGEKAGRRNGSERNVPNGSEPNTRPGSPANDPFAVADAILGRPPVLDDEALYAAAETLNRQFGRPPRLQELIEHSGGCQRQRASRAIQRLRHALAEKSVRSQLVLPQELEVELRGWVERWLRLAAAQLADVHAQMEEQQEQTTLCAQDLLAEQHEALKLLREQLEDQRRVATELSVRNRELLEELQRLRAEHAIANAVSDERHRLLEAFRNREDAKP